MKQQTINNLIASSNAVTSERKLSAMEKEKRDFEQYEAMQRRFRNYRGYNTQAEAVKFREAMQQGDDTGCY